MGDVLSRVLESKKFFFATVPMVINTIVVTAANAGYTVPDPTDAVMLLIDGIFVFLIAVQGMLDFKWGSPSDGTGAGDGEVILVSEEE